MQPASSTGNLVKTDLTVGPVPAIDWWSSVAPIPYTAYPNDPPESELYSVGFTINNKGFVLGGMLNTQRGLGDHVPDLWMFDPATQAWSKQAPYPGNYGLLVGEQVFVIGDNAFVIQDNTVWQYNQPSNQWMQKQVFPGVARLWGTAMAINGKGYFGLGESEYGNIPDLKDWWQYDPNTDSWTPAQEFGGDARYWAAGFAVDGKGYVCLGANKSSSFNTLWQYDPVADNWTKKQSLSGTSGTEAVAVSATINGVDLGLVADGSELWDYNPASDSWGDMGKQEGGGLSAIFVIGHSLFLANISVETFNWSK
jgi:N-acetylneuraminic acid mutarotase